MAKRRNGAARKRDQARHVVTVNMPAGHAALLRDVADLASTSVDVVARVILAMGIMRELAKLRGTKLEQARQVETARKHVWKANRKGRKLVAHRARR